jgi:hypothetical protein
MSSCASYAGVVTRRALPEFLAVAAVALTIAWLAPPAQGHGLTATGSERRLHSFETALLGPEHAAEHARLRRAMASPRWRRALRRATARVTATASAASAEPLDQVGRWNGEFDIPVFAINAVMLPTGKVLVFAYPNSPDYADGRKNESDAYLWNPALGTGAGSFTHVTPPVNPATGKPVNLFCAGASFTADGRVVVTGGNLMYPADSPGGFYAGLDQVYTFDPFSETWKRQPDMHKGRWYPSQLLMPDGRTFIMGGLDESGFGTKNQDLELFTPSAAMDGVGTVGLWGPEGFLGTNGADPDGPPVGDYYPHLFWMPSGHGLVAGPYTVDTWRFDPAGTDTSVFSFGELPNTPFSRVWGTAVLVPGGPDGSHEVMQLGGSDKPAADSAGVDPLAVDSATTFDERTPGWHATGALNVARSHANTVLLPDGSMATVGGGLGAMKTGAPNGSPGQYAAEAAQKQIELWDPVTRTWRLGPAQQEFRAYHSTALLLPDGRVLSAGDDYNGRFSGAEAGMNQRQDSAELYEPPYLFDGDAPAPRPLLTAAPPQISWGKTYDLAVTRAVDTRPVTRAVLVAPGAATHAVDMNQRFLPLAVTASSPASLTVRAPANGDIAPGGWYMLFVLDDTGTPSVARWVRLDAGAPEPEPTATPSPEPTATPSPEPTATPSPEPTATTTPAAEPAVTATPTPTPTTGPSTTPEEPTAQARIVRYQGRRRVKVTIGRSTRLTVRTTVTLRDKGGRTRKRVTVTLRTGRSTVLKKLRVARTVRSVRVRIR